MCSSASTTSNVYEGIGLKYLFLPSGRSAVAIVGASWYESCSITVH